MSDWQQYERILIPNIPNLHKLEVYRQHGGYEQIKKVLADTATWSPKAVTEEMKAANVRGRGGAGFNAGLKWSFMPPKKEGVPRYLACNGDESEPGTAKDRRLFEFNPHLLIEGCLIACYAMEMDAAYIYIRGEYADYIDILQRALDEAYAAGLVGGNLSGSGWGTNIYIHKGAGAYICGEETSLMESLEGNRAYPRSKPPFPAQAGLWGRPTTINNVETIAQSVLVMRLGAKGYSEIGYDNHLGPVLYGISGHVNRPGVYEYPGGMLITDLIYKVAGGMRNGRKLKALVPGGCSVPILRADEKEPDFALVTKYKGYMGGGLNTNPEGKVFSIEGVRMSADGLRNAGSSMGTGGMLVMDDTVDIVKFIHRTAQFYDHESCGQCTPCREGTGWLVKLVAKFVQREANTRDMDLLLDLCDNLEGRTVCALADAAAWPVRAAIIRFRDAFEARVRMPVAYAVA